MTLAKEKPPLAGEGSLEQQSAQGRVDSPQRIAAVKGLLEPIAAQIPSSLRAHANRWACWQGQWNDQKKKYDKPPYSIELSVVSNKRPWWSFDEAWTAYDGSLGGLSGVGFSLTVDEAVGLTAHGIVGIDLDRCVDPGTGEVDAWAQTIVEHARSYAELSPTGTGVRIFGYGTIAEDLNNHERGIEVYGASSSRPEPKSV